MLCLDLGQISENQQKTIKSNLMGVEDVKLEIYIWNIFDSLREFATPFQLNDLQTILLPNFR